ncbi:hypothetical protein MMPV_003341 [Pyropia vietnamensis]
MALRQRRRTRPPGHPPRLSSVSAAKAGAPPRRTRLGAATLRFVGLSFSRYRDARLPGWTPNPATAFLLLSVFHVAGALLSPFPADCDETMNYWEPLHYLVHGAGLRTWEHAPAFALRSYSFLYPAAVVARLAAMGGADKRRALSTVKVALSLAAAAAEALLYDSTVWRFGKPTARLCLAFLITSPGLFRAGGELLPSSFAMIATTAAVGWWMVGEFSMAIMGMAVAAVVGWPFAAALGIPLAVHASYRRGVLFVARVAVTAGALLTVPLVAVESLHYGRLVIPPLNLLLYNVINGEGGPNVFGVAPWTYYASSLMLNGTVAAACVAAGVLLWHIHGYVTPVWPRMSDMLTRVIFLSPLWVWLGVFWPQPHKEERFLAPIYPLLALSGAVSLGDWSSLLFRPRVPVAPATSGTPAPAHPGSRVSLGVVLSTLVSLAAVALSATLFASREAALHLGYTGHHAVYESFTRTELQPDGSPRHSSFVPNGSHPLNLCVASQWHRFPSHWFLPATSRLRFLRPSVGSPAMPLYYAPAVPSVRTGTAAAAPAAVNGRNEGVDEQWWDNVAACHYFVTNTAEDQLTEVPIDGADRMVVAAERVMDAARSPSPWRAFWTPDHGKRIVWSEAHVVRNLGALPLDG